MQTRKYNMPQLDFKQKLLRPMSEQKISGKISPLYCILSFPAVLAVKRDYFVYICTENCTKWKAIMSLHLSIIHTL